MNEHKQSIEIDALKKLKSRFERLEDLFWKRSAKPPRIVILGAGYAGLTCALGLRDLDAEVVLINPNDYHYLTTLLHEPAVGRRDFTDVTVDLPSLLDGSTIRLLKRKAVGIDLERQTVSVVTEADHQEIAYDFLVVALGSEPEFYHIPGLEEHALTLNNWSGAKRLHLRVEEALINYKDHPSEPWHAHIVVGGAGLTGVEVAGELADWCKKVARTYGIKKEHLRVSLVDGSPTILAACKDCQDRVIPLATQILKRKGVEILTDVRVERFERNRVVLDDGRELEAGMVIWTGGVRGHHLLEDSGLAINRQKRAIVNEFLQAQGHPEVFVIGDSAAATTEDGAVLPPTAQVAVHQGPLVADNFHRLFSGETLQSGAPKLMGIFLSLGHKDALGVIQNKYHFSGWLARMMKNAIGYRYLATLGGWRLVWAKLRKADVPVRALPPKHRDVEPSLLRRLATATIAGVLGTSAMTTFYTLITIVGVDLNVPIMLSGFFNMPLIFGWLLHGAIGMMLAWIYALFFSRTLPGNVSARGALFGLLPFLMAQTAIMPIMGAGVFSSNLGNLAFPFVLVSLVGHLLYSTVMAWLLSRRQFGYGQPTE